MCFTLTTIHHQALAAAYINHVVGSRITDQVGAIGRGGRLGWRQSGKSHRAPKVLGSTPSKVRKTERNDRGQASRKKNDDKKREKKRKKREKKRRAVLKERQKNNQSKLPSKCKFLPPQCGVSFALDQDSSFSLHLLTGPQ